MLNQKVLAALILHVWLNLQQLKFPRQYENMDFWNKERKEYIWNLQSSSEDVTYEKVNFFEKKKYD